MEEIYWHTIYEFGIKNRELSGHGRTKETKLVHK